MINKLFIILKSIDSVRQDYPWCCGSFLDMEYECYRHTAENKQKIDNRISKLWKRTHPNVKKNGKKFG